MAPLKTLRGGCRACYLEVEALNHVGGISANSFSIVYYALYVLFFFSQLFPVARVCKSVPGLLSMNTITNVAAYLGILPTSFDTITAIFCKSDFAQEQERWAEIRPLA